MTCRLPDAEMRTCIFSASYKGSRCHIHIHALGKGARLLSRACSITVRDTGISQQEARNALRYLEGSQLVHFDDAHAIGLMNLAIQSAGHPPLENEIYDIVPLAVAFCRVDGLPEHPALDDFAELFAVPRQDREAALHCSEKRALLVHKVWTDVVHNPLRYSNDLDAHAVAPMRNVSLVTLPDQIMPLPMPEVPSVPVPTLGWRRLPWAPEEARECALRFAEGASLEALSGLLRRSPRAIVARLMLDGILRTS